MQSKTRGAWARRLGQRVTRRSGLRLGLLSVVGLLATVTAACGGGGDGGDDYDDDDDDDDD